ncbi:uncharacterized protein BT62DRAFT_972461 [Guyanagaster necrorhizus]|uniref:MYND-type domain-containing protein n=1 Tax=Guyanagaster necrorhizus TaxID=856835 RepID=A0A9P8APX8_9AGAR|nr:uncharacterized protein BT62DRAFT_972461 [Guyanagaster necrorhizus MCA 3950]KAG7443479.1 hypothetical protein BT62DRAFT_972461 [Guyanagaster necrorhizus MCA 3950]
MTRGLEDVRKETLIFEDGAPCLDDEGNPIIMTCATLDPENLSKDSIVIMSNNSNPMVMTREQLANIIEDSGTLVRPCGACGIGPRQKNVKEFSKCASCKETCYCSKDCQRAHWKEHKALCKERQLSIASKKRLEEDARRKGEIYYDPVTLQGWYRKNHSAIEYAAFHALEIYKGASQSLLKTHFAFFDLSQNDKTPNDITTVTLKNVVAVPRSMIPLSENTKAQCERAVKNGYMCVYLADLSHKSIALEMHKAPRANWKKPDKEWVLNAILKCNVAGKI